MSGEIEVNEPVRVYDTSGPWGDADHKLDVAEGLPALRANWIQPAATSKKSKADALRRSTMDLRFGTPAKRNGSRKSEAPSPRKLETGAQGADGRTAATCARNGNCVTQPAWRAARHHHPEMEYIAIRESGRDQIRNPKSEARNKFGNSKSDIRNSGAIWSHQHPGNSFSGAAIPVKQ